jgi:hypothetical protein
MQLVDFIVGEFDLKRGFDLPNNLKQVQPIHSKIVQEMGIVLQDVLLHMQMVCQQIADGGFRVHVGRFLRGFLPIHDRPQFLVLAIMESNLGSKGGGNELFRTRCIWATDACAVREHAFNDVDRSDHNNRFKREGRNAYAEQDSSRARRGPYGAMSWPLVARAQQAGKVHRISATAVATLEDGMAKRTFTEPHRSRRRM